MSFLVCDEDPQSTLAAALALIDACDCTAAHDVSYVGMIPRSRENDDSAGAQATGLPQSANPTKHHPRVRKAIVEFKKRRRQVKELERTLSRLRAGKERRAAHVVLARDCADAGPSAACGGSVQRAATRRSHAPLRTAASARACGARERAAKCTRQEHLWVEDFHLLSALQKQLLLGNYQDSAALDYTQKHGTMAELKAKTEKLYALVNVIFECPVVEAPRDNEGGVSCTSKVKQDPIFGTFLERRSDASVNLPFTEAAQRLWQTMTSVCPPSPQLNLHVKTRDATDSSCESRCFMVVFDGPSGPVEMHGLSYKRKVEEAGRIVYVCSSVLFAPASGQVFRERGWLVITPDTEVEATNAALFRTCYQVFSDLQHGSGNKSSLLPQPHAPNDDIKELVLHVLSSRPRGAHQWIRKMARECAGAS